WCRWRNDVGAGSRAHRAGLQLWGSVQSSWSVIALLSGGSSRTLAGGTSQWCPRDNPKAASHYFL
ncbi:uncharacterized protein METZ01_LOCUS271904, partial [marine metagenome]